MSANFSRFPALLLLTLHLFWTAAGSAAEIDLKSLEPLEAKKKTTGGAYVGAFAGQTTSQSSSMELDYVGHSLEYDMIEDDGNLIAGFEVGYQWRTRFPIELGLEFEAFYGSSELRGVSSKSNTGEPITLSDVATTQTDLSYVAFMLNGTLTLDLRKYRPRLGKFLPRFRPYVGGGIGGAQLWYRNQRTQSFGDLLGVPTASSASPFSLDEFVFASQIFTGIEYRVNDKLGIYTEYRRLTFDRTSDVENLKTDILMGGIHLRY
jgi:opacity protein-like surface antigen